jgi:hypothetical protein
VAVKTLAQLRQEAAAGVPSLTTLRQQATAEEAAEVRDPLFGQVVTFRPQGPGWADRLGIADPETRKLFDPLDERAGTIVGRRYQPDAEGKLQTFYQLELGLPPEIAVAHTDDITEQLFGERLDYDDAWGRIGQAYQDGQVNVQLADLGLDVLLNRDTADTWREIERLRGLRSADFLAKQRPLWEKMLGATAEQLPLLGQTLEAAPVGGLVGGVAGAAAGVTVSAASPTLGEEALIPSLTFSGVKLGAGLAGAYRVGQLEAGLAVLDLLDAGIDPKIAKAASFGIGALNGALEMGQISLLLETLPGGKNLVKLGMKGVVDRLLAQGTLRNLAARHAAQFGGYLAAETLQELAQESVNITAEEFGKWLTERLGVPPSWTPEVPMPDWDLPTEEYWRQVRLSFAGADSPQAVQRATIAEIRRRLLEVGAKSLQSFTVLGAPGTALSVTTEIDALRRERSAVQRALPDVRLTEIAVPVPERAADAATAVPAAETVQPAPAPEIGPPAAPGAAESAAQAPTVTLYHGTDQPITVDELAAATPAYEGSLGPGIYLGQDQQTAEYYGAHVLEVPVRIGNPLVIDAAAGVNYRPAPEAAALQDETGAYESILTGEQVMPFDARIGGAWVPIRSAEDLASLSDRARTAGHDALVVRGIRDNATVNEEVVIFDRSAIVAAPSDEIRATSAETRATSAETRETSAAPPPAAWGSTNRLVTPEAYAEILARRKATGKLPGGRQAGGTSLFDPQDWADLAKAATFHFEAGARTFAAWSKRMIEDFGEQVRPALQQLWSSLGGASILEEPDPVRGALGDLSYAALEEKAKEIGVTVRGKKQQLAAAIAEMIKAKTGYAAKGQTGRRELKATEDAIRQHPIYQAAAEGAEQAAFRSTGAGMFYIPEGYKREVEGYAGQRFGKGANMAMWNMITHDPKAGQHWDDAAAELGWPEDLDGFLQRLQQVVAGERQLAGGLSEQALTEALRSGDPFLEILAEKRRLLRAGLGAFEVNQALTAIGEAAGMDRADYGDILIAGGTVADPADPHPGSLDFRQFMARLGAELGNPDSAWVRAWSLDVPEKPRAWHKRLVAEWEAIKAGQLTGDLSVGQVLATETLTAEQQAEIEAVDAEKVAEQIVEAEKQVLFGKLISGLLEDAAELKRLREALVDAYRAGTAEGVAQARAAYRAQQQRVKARKQLREYVAKLLASIRRPVGKTVAFDQRAAIEELQSQIDPRWRSRRTVAERQAARKFFAEHPEAQAPAKALAIIKAKSPSEWTVAELEQIARAVRELRRKGKILRTRENIARDDRRARDAQAVIDSVRGGDLPPLDLDAPIVRPPAETARDRWWHRYAATLTPERLFDWLDRRVNFAGAVFRIFWERVVEAESAKLVRIRARVAAAEAELARLNLTLRDLTADALIINGETITVQQAIGIYNFMQNLSARLAVTFGNRIGQADQTRVQEFVEARADLKALADWIVDHYDQHYDRLRQAVIDTEDRDMGREPNYTPIRRMEVDYSPDERQVLTEMMQRHHFQRGYAEKGMTISRKDIKPEYQKPIRLDAWTLLLEQIERQEHYIALGGIVKDLHALLSDEGVRAAVTDRGGKEVHEMLRRYVDAVGNPNIYRTYGEAERLARRIRRNTAIAFLAYKLSTMIKQPVSMVRMLPYAGLDLLRAGLAATAHWTQVRDFVTSRDPLTERPALERELEEMRARDPAKYEDLRQWLGEAGMRGLVWMDSVGRTIGWYGVYLHEMAAHGDEARAVAQARLATSLTQAGARVFQLPEIYRTSQEYLLLLTQFTNELNKLWNVTSYDLPMLMKNRQYERAVKTFIGIGIEASLMWMIANRRLPDDDDDAREIFGGQAVEMIPLIGPAVVAAYRGWGGEGVPALQGLAQTGADLYRLGERVAAGDVDDAEILDATHRLYKNLAPWFGVPYTGPRDLVRAVWNLDPSYVLGGPPSQNDKPQTAAGRRAAVRRRRRR